MPEPAHNKTFGRSKQHAHTASNSPMILNLLSQLSTASTNDTANLHAIFIQKKAWQMLFFHTDSVLGSDFGELIDIDDEEVDGSVVFREAKVFVQKGHAHARPGGDEVDDCEVVDYSIDLVLCE